MEIQSLQDFVMLAGDRPVTDSRKVAKQFDKRHPDVLRKIRSLLRKLPEWGARNFAHTPYIDTQNGENYDSYQMTKDGFMLLVMGFTGEKALQVKLAFIEAFNRMAEFVQNQAMGAWERYNAAYLEFRYDAAVASRAGSLLCDWGRGGRKADHTERLARLDPQMQLALPAVAQ